MMYALYFLQAAQDRHYVDLIAIELAMKPWEGTAMLLVLTNTWPMSDRYNCLWMPDNWLLLYPPWVKQFWFQQKKVEADSQSVTERSIGNMRFIHFTQCGVLVINGSNLHVALAMAILTL